MAGALIRRDCVERRRGQRRDGTACDWVTSVRLRPGRDVTLLNLSPLGAQIEASSRLLPGTCVEVQLATPDRRWWRSAQVLRCHVSALIPGGGVRYRAALSFDEALELPGDGIPASPRLARLGWPGDGGYCVPGAESGGNDEAGNDYPADTRFKRRKRRKWAVSDRAGLQAAWHRD